METQQTTAPLPHDLESAHRLIAALLGSEASLRGALDLSTQREEVLHTQIGEQERQLAAMQQQLHWLRNHVFGRRSEQGAAVEQQALPFATAAGVIEERASDEDARGAAINVPAHTRKRGGRRPLPEHLPREIVELLPAAAKSFATCPMLRSPPAHSRTTSALKSGVNALRFPLVFFRDHPWRFLAPS